MSRRFSRLLVEPGAADLADLLECAGFAQAISHALRFPAFDAEAFGELARVKRLRQSGRQQAIQIARQPKFVAAVYLDEVLVLDLVIVVATPSSPSVARIAVLFDLYEQHFKRQPSVGKHAREVNELLEHIEQ